MPSSADSIHHLRDRLRTFRADRDWDRFHDPKALILALTGEVGELAELFQWVPADEAQSMFSSGERQQRVAEEMSDVLIYLVQLADRLDIDLPAAAHAKLTAAEQRFPVADHHGQAPLKR